MAKKILEKNISDNNKNSYDAAEIIVLEGLEGIRKRPGMYIGGTGLKSLHHLVEELVNNSIDETLEGICKNIRVVIEENGSLSVEDDGRGIPVAKHPKYNKSALEVVMTMPHSGAKFNKKGYQISSGLNGIGLSAVNALSVWVDIIVKRDGKIWQLKLKNGEPVGSVKSIGTTTETGTKITFMPDDTIFDTVTFHADIIIDRLKEMSYLSQGTNIYFCDKRENDFEEIKLCSKNGIVEYVDEMATPKEPLHPNVIYFKGEKDGVWLECALQYTEDYEETFCSFVNTIRTVDGGTHEQGFKLGLSRAINELGRKRNIFKKGDTNLSGEDIREGLVAVISLKVPEPQFEGQTKGKLTNTEVRGIVDSIVYEYLCNYFNGNTNILSIIIRKAQETIKARELAKKYREISNKNTMDLSGLPSKLAKQTSNNPEECEIYIVEGDSAGGSAKQGRDRYYQAILPLRGKILNCQKEKLAKVLSSEMIKALITAMGTGISKEFNIETLRYHKVIIMTDADIDGSHIRILLLTFFYRFMRPLIEMGHIYIAQPPLYKLTKGKKMEYAYSDQEKDQKLKQMGAGTNIQRYKGLGEMNPQQLWDTTMDPKNRVLIRVTDEDAQRASKIFSQLMGNETEQKREIIERHAKNANVDFSNF